MITMEQAIVFAGAKDAYTSALRMAFDACPEFHGLIFSPKPGEANPFRAYIPMSFSMTLIDSVGGLEALAEWWEPEAK